MTTQQNFNEPSNALDFYSSKLHIALSTVDSTQFNLAVHTLEDAIINSKQIFVCGNGGSAAISEHFTCDHSKGLNNCTNLFPRVISLVSNMSLITAIANDVSFSEIFKNQLLHLGNKGDVLVVISSSGKSKNILNALEAASKLNMFTIALVGFDGGPAKQMADVTLHVEENNYGLVEDAHQALMHCMAQYIRAKHLLVPIEKVVF